VTALNISGSLRDGGFGRPHGVGPTAAGSGLEFVLFGLGVLFCSVVPSGTGLPARRDKTPAKRGVVGGEFGEEGISVEVEICLAFGDYAVVAG